MEQRAAVDQLVHGDRHIVHAGHDHLADLADPAGLLASQKAGRLQRVGHAEDLLVRILPLPEQTQRADDDGQLSLRQVVAAAVGVGVADGCLQLGQGDTELPKAIRVGLDLVTLDHAANARDAGDPGNSHQFPLDHIILDGLEVAERVEGLARDRMNRALEREPQDFTDGRGRGDLRRDARGQVHRRKAVEHILLGGLVITGVIELIANVGQTKERLAAGRLQPLHAGQGHLQRHGDLAFDLLGAGAGELGHDLDDRRRRVRIGLDVHVSEGVAAADRQRRSQQQNDERIGDGPFDEFANHGSPGAGREGEVIFRDHSAGFGNCE